MASLTTKKCKACSNVVESLLPGDVLCNECIAYQLGIQTPSETKRCCMCDTKIARARDLCDLCIASLKDSSILKRRRTDTLKLYKLYLLDPPTSRPQGIECS